MMVGILRHPYSIWFQIASLFFALSGNFSDLLIIRLCLSIAYIFVLINCCLGSPQLTQPQLVVTTKTIQLDGIIWSILNLYIHITTIIRLIQDEYPIQQLSNNNTNNNDLVALWRMFYRTGGLSQLLFNDSIGKYCTVVQFEPNDTIDTDQYCYIVYTGVVQLTVISNTSISNDDDYSNVSIREARSGQIFDFRSLDLLETTTEYKHQQQTCLLSPKPSNNSPYNNTTTNTKTTKTLPFNNYRIKATAKTTVKLFSFPKDLMSKIASENPITRLMWKEILMESLLKLFEQYYSNEKKKQHKQQQQQQQTGQGQQQQQQQQHQHQQQENDNSITIDPIIMTRHNPQLAFNLSLRNSPSLKHTIMEDTVEHCNGTNTTPTTELLTPTTTTTSSSSVPSVGPSRYIWKKSKSSVMLRPEVFNNHHHHTSNSHDDNNNKIQSPTDNGQSRQVLRSKSKRSSLTSSTTMMNPIFAPLEIWEMPHPMRAGSGEVFTFHYTQKRNNISSKNTTIFIISIIITKLDTIIMYIISFIHHVLFYIQWSFAPPWPFSSTSPGIRHNRLLYGTGTGRHKHQQKQKHHYHQHDEQKQNMNNNNNIQRRRRIRQSFDTEEDNDSNMNSSSSLPTTDVEYCNITMKSPKGSSLSSPVALSSSWSSSKSIRELVRRSTDITMTSQTPTSLSSSLSVPLSLSEVPEDSTTRLLLLSSSSSSFLYKSNVTTGKLNSTSSYNTFDKHYDQQQGQECKWNVPNNSNSYRKMNDNRNNSNSTVQVSSNSINREQKQCQTVSMTQPATMKEQDDEGNDFCNSAYWIDDDDDSHNKTATTIQNDNPINTLTDQSNDDYWYMNNNNNDHTETTNEIDIGEMNFIGFKRATSFNHF